MGRPSIAGLAGIAVGLAITTTGILVVLLLALDALVATAPRPRGAALVCGLTAAAVFGAASLVVSALPAAVLGLVAYAAVLALWRPAGLRAAWVYLRGLQ